MVRIKRLQNKKEKLKRVTEYFAEDQSPVLWETIQSLVADIDREEAEINDIRNGMNRFRVVEEMMADGMPELKFEGMDWQKNWLKDYLRNMFWFVQNRFTEGDEKRTRVFCQRVAKNFRMVRESLKAELVTGAEIEWDTSGEKNVVKRQCFTYVDVFDCYHEETV